MNYWGVLLCFACFSPFLNPVTTLSTFVLYFVIISSVRLSVFIQSAILNNGFYVDIIALLVAIYHSPIDKRVFLFHYSSLSSVDDQAAS